MTVVAWSPFREFEDIFSRVSRVQSGGVRPDRNDSEGERTFKPVANVSETVKAYLIKTELPEVAKDAIQVTINDGVVTIKGERRRKEVAADETLHRIESFYGSFARSFTLPPDVDESAISADSNDGVLTVTLPKSEVVEPAEISVKVN